INSEFKCCLILVADTLQKYNLTSADRAFQAGNQWIEKYSDMFSKFLSIDYKISRWNEWIEQSIFASRKATIEQLLKKVDNYSKAMNESVKEYVDRYRKRTTETNDSTFDEKQISDNCRRYLIEECAVILMLVETNYKYIVYPGKETSILGE